MGKNIKYIGGAIALTLLATAPVVASTIVADFESVNVKADSTKKTQQRVDENDKSSMYNDPNVPGSSEFMIYKFLEQFDDRYVASTSSLTTVLRAIAHNTDHSDINANGGYPYFNSEKPQHIYDMQNDAGVSGLKDRNKVEENGTDRGYFHDPSNTNIQYYNNDVFAYMSVEYMQDGKWVAAKLDSETDIRKFCYQLDGTNPTDTGSNSSLHPNVDVTGLSRISFPLRVTMHVVPGKDSNGKVQAAPDLDNIDPATLSKTFTVYPSTMDITTDKAAISIPKGTQLSSIAGNDKLKITDNYSNDTGAVKSYVDNMENPHYGSLFSSESDAIEYAKSKNFNPTNLTSGATGNSDASVTLNTDKTDGTINTPGSYYQIVSYKLSDGYKKNSSNKLDGDQAIGYMFPTNGKDPLTNVQTSLYDTTVNGTKATNGTDYIFNTDAQTLTIVRKIVVTGTDTPTNSIKSVEVNVGTKSTDKALDVSDNILKDGSTTLAKAAPTAGLYYKTNPAQDSDTQVVSDALNTPGTYYRALKYNLDLPSSSSIYNYDFGKNAIVDYDKGTVTYYQKVTVKAKSSSSGSGSRHSWTIAYPIGTARTKSDQENYTINNDDDQVINDKEIPKNTTLQVDWERTDQAGNKQYHIADGEWINADYVTFDNQDEGNTDWTYYQNPGYVVTFDKKDYYSLNNRENSIIKNRALAEKSAWVTDQYRTNKVGVKQYRVATNEWIDSHDVIFIKKHKGIVNVDETKSFYNLYNIEEHLITNRAVGERSSWYTDATAEDYNGNIYYRVANNEWIKQTDGVYIDTNAWY